LFALVCIEGEIMTVYNEDNIFKEARRSGYALTPIPESLTVHWGDSSNYYFDEVFDGSSLVWIDLMIESFREAFPEVDWMVDDPGTLYDQGFEDEECEESPYSLEKMQEVSQLTLERYESLFNRLVAAGVEVVSAE
jgi:hypothetical protein